MKIQNIVGKNSPRFMPIEQTNHPDNIFIRTQDSDPAYIDFKAKGSI